MPVAELASRMLIPALALGFVALYNTFYQLNYRRLGNIALWNNLQLTLDAIVVTVLVYYSGGVSSWFWSMYSLFILEAAFILPKRRDTWGSGRAVHAASRRYRAARVRGHSAARHHPVRDRRAVPRPGLRRRSATSGRSPCSREPPRWRPSSWASSAPRPQGRLALTVFDETTGLYSRAYFLRALGAEIRRAQRDDRPLHVLLIDVDHFGDFNRRFGIDAGDKLLNLIAVAITGCLSRGRRHAGHHQPRRALRRRGVRGPARRGPRDPGSAGARRRAPPRGLPADRDRQAGGRRRRSDRLGGRRLDAGRRHHPRRAARRGRRGALGGDRGRRRQGRRRCPCASRCSTRPRASTSSRSSVRRLGTALVGLALAVLVVGLALVPLTHSARHPRARPALRRSPRRRACLRSACSRSPSRSARSSRAPPAPRCPTRSTAAPASMRSAVSHLADVRGVISAARLVTAGSGGAAGRLARRRARARADAPRGVASCVPARSGVPSSSCSAGLAGTLDFDALFTAFHGLFFAEGTWTFASDSLLIQTFPEQFWATAAGVWAGLILLCAAGTCGRRGGCWRRQAASSSRQRKRAPRQIVRDKGRGFCRLSYRGRSSIVPGDPTIEAAAPVRV